MNNSFHIGDVLVTVTPPSGPGISHPVLGDLLSPTLPPPCAMGWNRRAVNGEPVPGMSTDVCEHQRMYVTPDSPVGFVLWFLARRATLAAQMAQEPSEDQGPTLE